MHAFPVGPPNGVAAMLLMMLAMPVAAAAADIAGAPWQAHTLRSGELHQECVNLGVADSLDYTFAADHKLDFNINLVSGNIMRFVVKKSSVKSIAAVFRPGLKRDYCMMWSNPGEQTVEFRYRFAVHSG
jgi:hypothetical protein